MTIISPTISGLYAVTPDFSLTASDSAANVAALLEGLRLCIEGGAALVQMRNKSPARAKREELAIRILELCRQHRVPLLINDDVELAAAIGADGVHLGKDDASVENARASLGAYTIVGVSCYNQLDLARLAEAQGADYVAFGRFYPSRTKPDAVPASLDLLRRAAAELRLPIAAIGGINAENGAELVAAGADLLAVIDAVFSAADIQRAAQDLSQLFARSR
jgi:thiamine-phosphate pyrophosphorylase